MTELEALHWVLENKCDVRHLDDGVEIIIKREGLIEDFTCGPTFLDAVIEAKRVSEKLDMYDHDPDY